MLLKEFLHSNPPFHPRRTLDQSYYWTHRSTKKINRDQVVFRGATPMQKFVHSAHRMTKKGEPLCRQYWDDIRKVPRVIMVGQLWLWILNGSTWCIFHNLSSPTFHDFVKGRGSYVRDFSSFLYKYLNLHLTTLQILSSQVSQNGMVE